MSEPTIVTKPAASVLYPVVTYAGLGLAFAMITSTLAPFALSAFGARLGAVVAFAFALGVLTPTLLTSE